MWLVNGNTELVHLEESSRVGKVVFQDDMNGRSRYTSMILSLRNTNNRVCMDVAMVATQSQPDWRPDVICQGSHEQYIIQYDVPMMDPLSEIQNRSVTLRHAIDGDDIISTGNNYATHILVCRSHSNKAIWRKQRTFLAAFNGINQVGDAVHSVHTLDSSTVLSEAVLLEITAQLLTTALLYTVRDDVGTVTINCDSEQGKASAMINMDAASTVMTSTTDYSGVTHAYRSSSEGFTTFFSLAAVDACIPVSACK